MTVAMRATIERAIAGRFRKCRPIGQLAKRFVQGSVFLSLLPFRSGDLFCTEQEGATWLANGNPFDELLHVQKGKHYGSTATPAIQS